MLKNNKALGTCNVSSEVLKALDRGGVSSLLCLLFNKILIYGMPSSWNVLEITSLHKKGDVENPNNFRGLSVMHVFAKLFSTCVNNKLTEVANEKGLRA